MGKRKSKKPIRRYSRLQCPACGRKGLQYHRRITSGCILEHYVYCPRCGYIHVLSRVQVERPEREPDIYPLTQPHVVRRVYKAPRKHRPSLRELAYFITRVEELNKGVENK